jgi:selenophosphate synthase
VPDDAYNLYWVSWKEARHSENIAVRAEVAIVIYSTEPEVDAVYISAEAQELTADQEVGFGIDIMSRKPQPEHWRIQGVADVTDMTGPGESIGVGQRLSRLD